MPIYSFLSESTQKYVSYNALIDSVAPWRTRLTRYGQKLLQWSGFDCDRVLRLRWMSHYNSVTQIAFRNLLQSNLQNNGRGALQIHMTFFVSWCLLPHNDRECYCRFLTYIAYLF